MCLRDLFGVWVGDVSLWCICVSEISVCVCVSVRDLCGVSEISLWCMGQRGICSVCVRVKSLLCDISLWCMCMSEISLLRVCEIYLWCVGQRDISVEVKYVCVRYLCGMCVSERSLWYQ